MEIKEITQEIRERLKAKLPDEAVSQHPTKTYLSSIKAIYVIERLNDVFGVGKWTYDQKVIERADNGTVVVQVDLSIPEYGIRLSSFGGNDNGGESANKNFDLGDAYKGAVTDAITKICSMLEIGIDVFKGLHTHKEKPKSTAPSDAPWINDNEVNVAIEKINSGTTGVLEDLLSKFKISKANRAKIEDAVKNYKPSSSAKPTAIEKPELTPVHKNWNEVVKWLAGKDGLIFDHFETIREKYTLSDVNEKKLSGDASLIRAKGEHNSDDVPEETLLAIKEATDMESLTRIYNECTDLHTSKAFVNAYAARQRELAKLGKAA